MSKASRDKGSRGERMFASELFERTGVKLRRNLTQYQSKGDCDLVPDPQQPLDSILLVSDLAIEIKNYEKVTDGTIKTFWSQAVEQGVKAEKTPVLAVKASRQKWRVFVPDYKYFPLEDVRGLMSMDIDMFCAKVSAGEFKCSVD